jgi:hypothetical protein
LIHTAFTHPDVREAAKDAMLLAVHDVSRQMASRGRVSIPGSGTRLRDEIRRWDVRSSDRDPKFARVMDAFVAHRDKFDVERIRAEIHGHDLSPDQATHVWQAFDGLSLKDKKAFTVSVAAVESATSPARPVDPRMASFPARPVRPTDQGNATPTRPSPSEQSGPGAYRAR